MKRVYPLRISRAFGAALFVACCWTVGAAFALENDFEIGGCTSYSDSRGCALDPPGTIDVWVSHESGSPVSVHVGRGTQTAADTLRRQRVQGGTHFRLRVPEESTTLSVTSGNRQWTIDLHTQTQPDDLASVRDLNRNGHYEQSVRLVEQVLPSLESEWRSTALRYLGQAQMRLGRSERAAKTLSLSVDADRQAKRPTSAVRTMTVLAFSHMQEGDYAQARELLEYHYPASKRDADSQYNLAYFRGLLAYNTGDARAAIRQFGAAAKQAQRMGRATQQVYAEVLLAVQLQRIGRSDDANRYLSRWIDDLPDDLPKCDEARVLNNVAWTRLLLLESGEQAENPTSLLQRANELMEQHCTTRDRTNTLTNLALARLHAGDAAGAERVVANVRAFDSLDYRTVLWLLEAEGRIAMARGEFDSALERYDRLDDLAAVSLSIPERWRAVVGRARALASGGDLGRARGAYQTADALLLQYLPAIPIDQGRESLLNARSGVTREHTGLLLSLGRDEEAFTLARASRNRSLRSIRIADQIGNLDPEARLRWEQALNEYRKLRGELDASAKDAWMLPADQLRELTRINRRKERQLRDILDRATQTLGSDASSESAIQESMPLAEGELTVLMSRSTDGWVVFAKNSSRLSTHQPSCDDEEPARLAACLLADLGETLEASRSVRFMPSGILNEVDFQNVTVNGAPLINTLPVYYSLDLGQRFANPAGNRSALLVADAGGDLAAARKELESVSETLDAASGWRQKVLHDTAATAESVVGAMQDVQLFHFAGHARYAGEFGWDSHMELAGDSVLGVADILTLGGAPNLVVLSGCDTARSRRHSIAQSMGLANAFLVAGSDSVLATSRPVRDRTAERLMTGFYRYWTGGHAPHVALRNAQLDLMKERPQSDWAAYRLIVR